MLELLKVYLGKADLFNFNNINKMITKIYFQKKTWPNYLYYNDLSVRLDVGNASLAYISGLILHIVMVIQKNLFMESGREGTLIT